MILITIGKNKLNIVCLSIIIKKKENIIKKK